MGLGSKGVGVSGLSVGAFSGSVLFGFRAVSGLGPLGFCVLGLGVKWIDRVKRLCDLLGSGLSIQSWKALRSNYWGYLEALGT